MFLHVDHGVEDSRNVNVFKYLSAVKSTVNCPLHHVSSKWIDSKSLADLISDLKRSMSDSKRNALLVSGMHLEDQITVCSLEALIEGFDVHLLCDIISARDIKLKPVLLLRLFQAGAVPSSLRQFLYMWLAAETEEPMTESLRGLLDQYDSIFGRRPA
jgi:hypothetical protein